MRRLIFLLYALLFRWEGVGGGRMFYEPGVLACFGVGYEVIVAMIYDSLIIVLEIA